MAESTENTKATGVNTLLDADLLKKLERLSVAAKRPFPGRMQGEKRSTKRGASVEFADYRDYATGDDLRYVDWRAYARLERLFVKLFVEEEDLTIHLLVDASQSMLYGGPDTTDEPTKFDRARKLAAALGYVGLARYDRVQVAGFSQNVGRRIPTLRGRMAAGELFSYLETLKAGGQTDFTEALRHYAARASGPGICVVLSDFYDPNWTKGVRALLSRRMQVVLLQILTPAELSPQPARRPAPRRCRNGRGPRNQCHTRAIGPLSGRRRRLLRQAGGRSAQIRHGLPAHDHRNSFRGFAT